MKVVVVAYILLLVSAVELGWLVLSTYSAVDANLTDNPSKNAGSGSGIAFSSSSGGGSSGIAFSSGSGLLPIMEPRCSSYDTAVSLFSLLVGTGWLVCASILFSFGFLLDPCGCCLGSTFVKRIAKKQKYHKEDYSDVAERSLTDFDKFDSVKGRYANEVGCSLVCAKLRETFCFCCRRDGLKTSRADALSDVVQVLRVLFSDLDVTFSDLLAGFLLASLYQRKLKAAHKDRDHELSEVSGEYTQS